MFSFNLSMHMCRLASNYVRHALPDGVRCSGRYGLRNVRAFTVNARLKHASLVQRANEGVFDDSVVHVAALAQEPGEVTMGQDESSVSLRAPSCTLALCHRRV